MKKLTFLAGLLVVIGGAIYGVIYLDRISTSPPFYAQPMELPQVGGALAHRDEHWFELLPNNDEIPYAYPATELSVRFDFASEDSKHIAPSAISIDGLDEYKFACLKQVLAQNRIESAYYKSGETLKLMVFVDNEVLYKKLLEDLQYYRLEYSVQ